MGMIRIDVHLCVCACKTTWPPLIGDEEISPHHRIGWISFLSFVLGQNTTNAKEGRGGPVSGLHQPASEAEHPKKKLQPRMRESMRDAVSVSIYLYLSVCLSVCLSPPCYHCPMTLSNRRARGTVACPPITVISDT